MGIMTRNLSTPCARAGINCWRIVPRATGKVVVEFRLHPDGRITDLNVAQNEMSDLFGLICAAGHSRPCALPSVAGGNAPRYPEGIPGRDFYFLLWDGMN